MRQEVIGILDCDEVPTVAAAMLSAARRALASAISM
jgi:hypothetical protein